VASEIWPIDAALFEVLLHEEERKTLDFKRDQYRFVKASLDDRAELLKDLLGFANAIRREDAYILIRVEDVRGGRGNIVGISEHLDDHSLQQFIAHNTNRTLHFHYEAFTFEGKNVGIFRIDIAPDWPLTLVRDIGQLKKGAVYLRRGSYTDPTKPATADEIALMGRAGGLSTNVSRMASAIGTMTVCAQYRTTTTSTSSECHPPPQCLRRIVHKACAAQRRALGR
jgi:predicted HTH transcriptional regulator